MSSSRRYRHNTSAVTIPVLFFSTDKQQQSLQSELVEVRERERALVGCQTALQSQLERLQRELVQCREQLETDRLQLSKTVSLNQTLQRKHQVRKSSLASSSDDYGHPQAGLSRQREILQRVEEMDRETEELRRELASTTRARDQLVSRVETLVSECSSLQSQVAEHEVSKL